MESRLDGIPEFRISKIDGSAMRARRGGQPD